MRTKHARQLARTRRTLVQVVKRSKTELRHYLPRKGNCVMGLLRGEKSDDIRFDAIRERDRQTDRQTDILNGLI